MKSFISQLITVQNKEEKKHDVFLKYIKMKYLNSWIFFTSITMNVFNGKLQDKYVRLNY